MPPCSTAAIVALDEPTIGLDVVARGRSKMPEGATTRARDMLLTSHYMPTLGAVFPRAGVSHGRWCSTGH